MLRWLGLLYAVLGFGSSSSECSLRELYEPGRPGGSRWTEGAGGSRRGTGRREASALAYLSVILRTIGLGLCVAAVVGQRGSCNTRV